MTGSGDIRLGQTAAPDGRARQKYSAVLLLNLRHSGVPQGLALRVGLQAKWKCNNYCIKFLLAFLQASIMIKLNRVQEYLVSRSCIVVLLAALIAASGCGKSGSSQESGGGGAVAGSGNFEGAISMAMTGVVSQPATITYYIKGQHARVETSISGHSQPDSIMLWDASSGKITTLLVQQKSYMTMDRNAMQAQADAHSNSSPGAHAFPKITDTGKQETVAGYPCHDWVVGDKQDIELCLAKGLGDMGFGQPGPSQGLLGRLLSPNKSAEAAAHPELAKMTEGGAFPLKMTMTEDGKTKMKMEATSIDRKTIDDSLFTIPAGYSEFKAPSIPGLGAPSK